MRCATTGVALLALAAARASVLSGGDTPHDLRGDLLRGYHSHEDSDVKGGEAIDEVMGLEELIGEASAPTPQLFDLGAESISGDTTSSRPLLTIALVCTSVLMVASFVVVIYLFYQRRCSLDGEGGNSRSYRVTDLKGREWGDSQASSVSTLQLDTHATGSRGAGVGFDSSPAPQNRAPTSLVMSTVSSDLAPGGAPCHPQPSEALIASTSMWQTHAGLPMAAGAAGATVRHDIIRPPGDTTHLEDELDTMIAAMPPQLFARNYLLVCERTGGGQALVQFALSHDGACRQYAIKFFHRLGDFAAETALYEDPAIRPTLPALVSACGNDGTNALTRRLSPRGFLFPPHIIVERGTTMKEWRRSGVRGVFCVLAMFEALTEHLARLHGAGHVHRDLKPDNVLVMSQSHSWRLIDYGIAATSGSVRNPSCTLTYAAPEVLHAFQHKQPIAVEPAQDIWALGVMVYEALTNTILFPAFTSREEMFAHGTGAVPYPWETADTCPLAFETVTSAVRSAVLQCLQRDPMLRPSAVTLLKQIGQMGNTR